MQLSDNTQSIERKSSSSKWLHRQIVTKHLENMNIQVLRSSFAPHWPWTGVFIERNDVADVASFTMKCYKSKTRCYGRIWRRRSLETIVGCVGAPELAQRHSAVYRREFLGQRSNLISLSKKLIRDWRNKTMKELKIFQTGMVSPVMAKVPVNCRKAVPIEAHWIIFAKLIYNYLPREVFPKQPS